MSDREAYPDNLADDFAAALAGVCAARVARAGAGAVAAAGTARGASA